jgi:hypothetical protein
VEDRTVTNENTVTKAVVSVSDMARAVGLSRARFYQLVRAGTFPQPERDPVSGRPCYTQEQQIVVLEVRRRNRGIDDKPVLFYARRRDLGTGRAKPAAAAKPKVEAKKGDVTALIDGLNALGMTTATAAQVEKITQELYPQGTAGLDRGQVLRAVFLEIRRRHSSGSAG